jgi:hypothetical protein
MPRHGTLHGKRTTNTVPDGAVETAGANRQDITGSKNDTEVSLIGQKIDDSVISPS